MDPIVKRLDITEPIELLLSQLNSPDDNRQ